MEKSKKVLLVSGLGILAEHLVAAAIALRRHPQAQIAFASMGVLPDVLDPFAKAGFAEVHLLGIGLGVADPVRLDASFRNLAKSGARIVWHSAGYPVPDEVPLAVQGLFEARVGAKDGLAAFVAEEFGIEAGPLLAILAEKPETDVAKLWKERIAAAGWMFSNAHDFAALESIVRDLAGGVTPAHWGDPANTLVQHYRVFGTRELQASGPRMRKVRKEIGRIAKSGVRRVLVTGESGVGKETVAQQLHVQSGRRGPYLAFNCATVASSLIEGRLFGHVRGAFTDARADSPGLFRDASGGTLFLDEIAELPIEVQGVLLRVLQDGVVQPVGASREVKVDVLVVAATNRDLRDLVRRRLFREDLYWRLSVVQIRMPPLRERGSDLAATARQIWSRLAPKKKPLSKEDVAAIESYDWPGNVRELSNVLERATLFDDLSIADLVEAERAEAARLEELSAAEAAPASPPPPAKEAPPAALPPPSGPGESLDAVIRAHVRSVYERHGRNLAETARALGIARNTLRRHLSEPRAGRNGRQPSEP